MSNTISGTASTIDEPYLGPVRGGERYNSLDVVRGAALFLFPLRNNGAEAQSAMTAMNFTLAVRLFSEAG